MAQISPPSPGGRLNRRSLLKAGGAAAALGLVGAGGAVLYGHAGRYPEASPACELLSLDKREFAIVLALAEALFPDGNRLGVTARQARVPEYTDRYLAGMEPTKAQDLKAMFLLFEHGTLAFGLRVRRFTELNLAARERYLRHWERSRIYARRSLITALKTVLGLAYFAHPDVQARLGITRSCGSPADALPRAEWS